MWSLRKAKPSDDRRDPLTGVPLREPGQSLREELEEVAQLQFAARLEIVATVWVLVLLEALLWWAGVPRHPKYFLPVAIPYTIYQGIRIYRVWPLIRTLRLGMRGERLIGQFLDEKVRPFGYHVIHDLRQDGYNIDHVIVGPGGVFAVDTKTRSKRRGKCEVVYDGRTVLVNGHRPDQDPIAQARAVRDRVREILRKRTGRDVFVRGVVVYGGWFVRSTVPNPDVWVENEKMLIGRVVDSRPQLSPEDIALYTGHLKEEATRER